MPRKSTEKNSSLGRILDPVSRSIYRRLTIPLFMNLKLGATGSIFENSPFGNLVGVASRMLMARKGGKGKAPAGCSGAYRPYSTALKLEQLRKGHDHSQGRTADVEPSVGTAIQVASRKGMELRSRPVRHSPRQHKKQAPKFKLDELEAVTASPEQGKRADIQRSSTAGNGRRVSAAPSGEPARFEGTGSEPHSQGRLTRRRDSQNEESNEDIADDMDMVAPLRASSPNGKSAGEGSPPTTPGPKGKPAFKRALHADDSDGLLLTKRMKFSSPPTNSIHPNSCTPQSYSRHSTRSADREDLNGTRRGRTPENAGVFGSGNVQQGSLEQPSPIQHARAERSVPPLPHPEVQYTDMHSRLERLLTSLRTDVLNEVRDSQQSQAAQLRKLDVKFTEMAQSIRAQLQDLSGVVQSRSAGQGSATSAQCKTPLAEWEQKLEEMTPFKKEVFSSSVFSRVLGYNLPLCVTKICADLPDVNSTNVRSRNIVEKASDSLATLLFSLKPNDSRDKNGEGVGKLHSEFKFSVIQNTFYNVQKNTFRQFKGSGAGEEDENRSSSQSRGLLTQPLWLKPGFVSPTTILAARSFLENKQQAKRDKVKDAPSRNDIAMHGAVKAYRYLTSHLHDGREKVKSMFFQDLGYLLVDWAGLISDVDQTELSLVWEEEPLESINGDDLYFNLRNIPETHVARGGEGTNDADASNRGLITDLYKKSKEMVLIAEHHVFVLSGDSSRNKQRKHSGGQRRPMRRLIHMIEVAPNFCKEFTKLPDIWSFLRSHTDSLRCIYAIAIVFREMTAAFLCNADLAAGRIPSPSDVAVARTSLIHLLPGKGSRASLMASRCVRMVESEYETMNQPVISIANRPRHADPEYNAEIGAEIQASAALGVAAL